MNKVKNCYNIGSSCEQIHRTVASAAKEDDMLLILGGDHSIAMGTVSAICRSRPKTGIVWVDAHADINTPAGTGPLIL
jgi:arginase